ncbi:MAG: hypothetical protein KBG15_00010 [Kofleriaceae bacterium]|nr:hypothetical protein [Kofleriaceae bacterium]
MLTVEQLVEAWFALNTVVDLRRNGAVLREDHPDCVLELRHEQVQHHKLLHPTLEHGLAKRLRPLLVVASQQGAALGHDLSAIARNASDKRFAGHIFHAF